MIAAVVVAAGVAVTLSVGALLVGVRHFAEGDDEIAAEYEP
jgi:hypothetical protein